MKTKFTIVRQLLIIVAASLPILTLAQYNPGLPASFGIDGDALSGQSQNIAGTTPQGSFDWFKKTGTGVGVIDTTGTASLATRIAAGQNVTFDRGLAFSRYSSQNGYLLLDARYARDNFGYSFATGQRDFSTFTNGSKNGDDPSTWKTSPAGATVAAKADILDSYVHMLRDGTVINNTNPSHLIIAMGVSTIGNTGNRYIDFELFRSRVAYDGATGVFSNSGASVSGGHTPWVFNSTGTVKEIGDMSISFTYSTAGVSEISAYIWVAKADYDNVVAANFNFVPGAFYGSTFGYAKVIPISSSVFMAWGSVTSNVTPAAPWGTNSKTLGSSPNNYYSANYAANDFGEVALDLTSMGIDPALSVGMDACSPPYTRIMIKSRSSASFTSALQDFSGPYEFLDAPVALPQIATPGVLNCKASTVVLSPAVPIVGASYQWTTSDGNILSDPNGTSVTVDKAGKYFLTSSIVAGCPSRTDSTTVGEDYDKPVAAASVVGQLTEGDPTSSVTLVGENRAVNNISNSLGLEWSWSGPNGFSNTQQNASTNEEGEYTLVVTELRNGCSDTAITAASMAAILPVKLSSFSAVLVENKSVNLSWITEFEQNNSHFEIERSFDSRNFTTVAIVLDGMSTAASQKSYQYVDASADLQGKQVVYYRINQLDKDGKSTYSSILAVKFYITSAVVMQVSPNPFVENIILRFNSEENASAEIRMLNVSGQNVLSQKTTIAKGYNNIQVDGLHRLTNGLYIVQVVKDGVIMSSQKLIKN